MYHLGAEYLQRLHRAIDSLVPVLMLFVIFLLINRGDMPDGFSDFLAMRLTVLNILKVGCLALAWPRIFAFCRLYEYRAYIRWSREITRLVQACSLGSMIVLLFALFDHAKNFYAHHVLYFWLGTIFLTATTRLLVRWLAGRDALYARDPHKVLIVGSGQMAVNIYRTLFEESPTGYEFVGFVDSFPQAQIRELPFDYLIGSLDDLESILASRVVDEVLIALPIKSQYDQIEAAIQTCDQVGVESKYVFDKFASIFSQQRFERGNMPAVAMKLIADDYRRLIKRILDVVVALGALAILSPVLLVIVVAIKLTSKGPIVFTQDRFGQNKRLFKMFKFRTMVTDAEALLAELEQENEASGPIFKMKNDPRITPLGRFLRKTSLDELPQLFNILRGEMSLVGPRPLPLRDVSNFEAATLMRRFCVPPGLTCLWQVSGRSTLGGEDLVALDLQYIDKWSLRLDLQILARTVPVVLKGSGAI